MPATRENHRVYLAQWRQRKREDGTLPRYDNRERVVPIYQDLARLPWRPHGY